MGKNYRFNGLTLSEYIDEHRGELIQIGCKNGSGFLYAGKLGRFTLDAMRSVYHCRFDECDIVDRYPSIYGGTILIIAGAFTGKAELPKELITKYPEAPIEKYIAFADVIAGRAAEAYKTALIGIVTGPERNRAACESEIFKCEEFFRSDTFSIICPHADGEQIISLIKKQVRKELKEIERRRKEREQRLY